ncbi:MAG: hypothetical protein K1563_15920 [Candidatus Thiodiazotropha sp. (ex. Lucinisca nassula)]|uniref:hypothetical protein n=1 Tax=Candidatus Thiodiazotropha sp. LNASS1 TaxID=3096260 RepID=UPI002812DFEA|nr:hypothetical protein [Candidatus Thiodiazotropha sp. (ex. Lucinisca nassula)]
MLKRSIIIASLSALLFTSTTAVATKVLPPPKLNEAQKLVFFKDHLKGVPKGSRIDYGFKSMTKDADSFSDSIEIKVTDVVAEGKRDLEFNFLTGSHHIDFSPAKAYTGNPVIIHFLERDISKMAKNTGGNIGFFRNRIRNSFAKPMVVREIDFKLNGKAISGTEIVITPFVADPYAENFKLYVNKRYEFIFSDQVPGGVYRIHTKVPSDSGDSVLIDEDMIFRQITPAI